MDLPYIGRKVHILLRQPEGRTVEGLVAGVDSKTSTVTLHDALFTDSGHRFPLFPLHASAIADLRFPEEQRPSPPRSVPPVPQPRNLPRRANDNRRQTVIAIGDGQPFEDPAILTVNKRHSVIGFELNSDRTPLEAPTVTPAAARPPAIPPLQLKKASTFDAATLQAPFSGLDMPAHSGTELKSELAGGDVPYKKTIRNGSVPVQATNGASAGPASGSKGKQRQPKPTTRQPEPQDEITSPARSKARHKKQASASYHGKGWRQTPILKERQEPGSDSPAATLAMAKKKPKKVRRRRLDEQIDWSTEEAAGIQEMPDFDFAGSLAKFDKISVFEQLRKQDHIAPEQRLVGHNRLNKPIPFHMRPGTFGGKNLHPTENVLDEPVSASRRSSRRSSALHGKPSTGSDSAARAGSASRLSSRTLNQGPARVTSFPKEDSLKYPTPPLPARSSARLQPRHSGHSASLGSHASSHTSVPAPVMTSSASTNAVPHFTPLESPYSPAFHADMLDPDLIEFINDHNDEPCPSLAPGSIHALEDLAESAHLTPDVMNENAGRSLAEIVTKALSTSRSTHLTAIIFAGNHRTGARALAAARHLRARGVIPVCCLLGLDRPGRDLLPEVERQVDRLGDSEAVIANWRETHKYLVHSESGGSFADVYIDALLAPGRTYDVLVPEEQAAVREMVAWANTAPVGGARRLIVSVDMPCGLNASTGEPTHADDGSRLQMRARHVVSMGAPRLGLLAATKAAWAQYAAEEGAGHTVPSYVKDVLAAKLWVVDVGINRAWREYGEDYGLADGKGVEFGLEWVVGIRVGSCVEEDDDEGVGG